MLVRKIHDWDIDYKSAIALQKNLSKGLSLIQYAGKIRYVIGLDVSSNFHSDQLFAAAVVWDCNNKKVVETSFSEGKAKIPYIPGLLSFREAPLLIEALEKIVMRADLILVDGHGIAHPRRFGIASHIGSHVDIPVIGCAKKKLFGEYVEPGKNKFDYTYLKDNKTIIGIVFRSRDGVKPIFISPGNNIDLKGCLNLIKQTIGKYRIPEPLRNAHFVCNQLRKKDL
jgi:deoxyribonuclease V